MSRRKEGRKEEKDESKEGKKEGEGIEGGAGSRAGFGGEDISVWRRE